MAEPNYDRILKALPRVSEILPGLFQGGRLDTYDGYDVVVSCEQFLAKGPMRDWAGLLVHVPMVDADEFKIREFDVEAAAGVAVLALLAGRRVLVHCSAGLNRSSLVTVTALGMGGRSRREAVDLLRARRCEFCLCNRAFERFALDEPLPTAETSAFRGGA